MITTVQCRFKREQGSQWEYGLAITSEPGLSNVITIMAAQGKSLADALTDVWDYQLLWTDGMLKCEAGGHYAFARS